MKLAKIVLAGFFAVNGQRLSSTCENDNLVIDIPYPDEATAQLLYLQAGTCDQTNYGGSLTYDSANSVAKVSIPISSCGLKGELYGTPVTERSSFGLYRPTANITFGNTISGHDVIFRNMHIAAECGTRTSYTVEFNYDDIKSSDTEGCQEHDGVCVFPAYEDAVQFSIEEYTDDKFDTVINEDAGNMDLRAKLAGETIYLSLRASGMPDGYKFAVTECEVISGEGVDEQKFTLLNPGVAGGECKLDGIGLKASYDTVYDANYDEICNFNFQHILFLLNGHSGTSSFKLTCTAEVCDGNDADSKCNQAVLPCMEKEDEKKKYMCKSFRCDDGQECDLDNDAPVCVSTGPDPNTDTDSF